MRCISPASTGKSSCADHGAASVTASRARAAASRACAASLSPPHATKHSSDSMAAPSARTRTSRRTRVARPPRRGRAAAAGAGATRQSARSGATAPTAALVAPGGGRATMRRCSGRRRTSGARSARSVRVHAAAVSARLTEAAGARWCTGRQRSACGRAQPRVGPGRPRVAARGAAFRRRLELREYSWPPVGPTAQVRCLSCRRAAYSGASQPAPVASAPGRGVRRARARAHANACAARLFCRMGRGPPCALRASFVCKRVARRAVPAVLRHQWACDAHQHARRRRVAAAMQPDAGGAPLLLTITAAGLVSLSANGAAVMSAFNASAYLPTGKAVLVVGGSTTMRSEGAMLQFCLRHAREIMISSAPWRCAASMSSCAAVRVPLFG